MNIGMDFDDTIAAHPEEFAEMAKAFSSSGHDLYIISSFSEGEDSLLQKMKKYKTDKLKEWGISYKGLFMPVAPIPENKSKICSELSIDIMIDDNCENLSTIMAHNPKIVCLRLMESTGMAQGF